jgi:hypothetical protein
VRKISFQARSTRPDSPTPSGGLARFDLETAEDVLAPQIKKIASYEAA